MDAAAIRNLQAPLKDLYRSDPAAAQLTLHARGTLDVGPVSCTVQTPAGPIVAGLHPATGGDGTGACSGDMLLQALVACAGVTLASVASAMGIAVTGGTVSADGDLDFRGTLGISKEVQVGFRRVKLRFELQTDAPQEKLEKLLELTERYCVVLQTLRVPAQLDASIAGVGSPG